MKIPEGFLFSGIHSGIKKKGLDLGLVYSKDFLDGVYFFTDNKVKAAPIVLDLKKLKKNKGRIKAVIVNSGNANCFTEKSGIKDAEHICKETSELLDIDPNFVLASSTGVIGKKLPLKKILKSIPKLVFSLNKDIYKFAEAILTTDTFRKVSFRKIKIKNTTVRILGVAKGAGMIYPKLKQATMLAFIFTDINIKNSLLKKAARKAIEASFNSISVDACRSTNDSVFILTSKKANKNPLKNKGRDFEVFSKNLNQVCLDLAKKIIQDAEGSTKFIKILIKGAGTIKEAKKAAFSIANSNLFKAAMYGENSNWGRIVSALGQAGIFVKDNISIKTSPLKKRNVEIIVDLKRGKFSWIVYTSDLSCEYVRINAQYS